MGKESVDRETVVQSLVKALRSAGAAASQHGGASFTIWPDRNHEWQGIVEALKEKMPELYVFGDYDPPGRQEAISQAGPPLGDCRKAVGVICRIAQEARSCARGEHDHTGINKQAPEESSNACPTLLPLLDELRTYCYEHRIEEISALLVGGAAPGGRSRPVQLRRPR